MNASNLYSRSRLGLDNRVWLVLIITILLSGSLLAFKMATNEACHPIRIDIEDNDNAAGVYYLRDRLSFKAVMAGAGEVVWDFGDQTPPVKGNQVQHSFAGAGNYFVTVTVNNKCREFKSILIHTPVVHTASADIGVNEEIRGPEAPKAGEPASYTSSLHTSTYEWNVLNSPEYPTQNTPVATYIFKTDGIKNIELKLDNGKVVRKQIQVLPADKPLTDPNAQPVANPNLIPAAPPVPEPAAQEPSKSKSTFIADEVFRDMFDKVTEGDKDASSFNEFLCNGAATKVRDNGDSWTTLGEFCSKIHDKKKYSIKSVITIRDPADKCVLQIQVKYKKKGFLGL